MAKKSKVYNFDRLGMTEDEDGVSIPGRECFLADVAAALGPEWRTSHVGRWARDRQKRPCFVREKQPLTTCIIAEFADNKDGDTTGCYLYVGGTCSKDDEGGWFRANELPCIRSGRTKVRTAMAETYGIRVRQGSVRMDKIVAALSAGLEKAQPHVDRWTAEEEHRALREKQTGEATDLLLTLAGFEKRSSGYRNQLCIPGHSIAAEVHGNRVNISIECAPEDVLSIVGEAMDAPSTKV